MTNFGEMAAMIGAASVIASGMTQLVGKLIEARGVAARATDGLIKRLSAEIDRLSDRVDECNEKHEACERRCNGLQGELEDLKRRMAKA